MKFLWLYFKGLLYVQGDAQPIYPSEVQTGLSTPSISINTPNTKLANKSKPDANQSAN